MGFFKDLASCCKEVGKEIGRGIKKAAEWTGEKLEDLADWTGKKLQTIGGMLTKDEPTDIYPAPDTEIINRTIETFLKANSNFQPTGNYETSAKQATQDIAVFIDSYQKRVRKRTSRRENNVKSAFLEFYSDYVKKFDSVIDEKSINDINNYVSKKSDEFNHLMRDYVNRRVNPSNHRWKRLIHDCTTTPEDVEDYCDEVYDSAENVLLDKFQTSIEETNEYMRTIMIKFNEDRAKALTEMKTSLIKLTADERSKQEEQLQIAKELAVLTMINEESQYNQY